MPNGAVNVSGGLGHDKLLAPEPCKERRINRVGRIHFRDGAKPQARHERQLHHNVRSHLACSRKADGDRLSRFSARLQFIDERRNIGNHGLPFFLLLEGSRRGASTAGASPFAKSPAFLP